MPSPEDLRTLVRVNIDDIARRINLALKGKQLKKLQPVLRRIGRGGILPHWYERLASDGVLPNLDGKTIGSVMEMLLVAVLETTTFSGIDAPPLRINPARGIDLPDLELGVKSPSENYCTSEPFFSAYDRLLGAECDVLVLLTDYQTAKQNPPLRLQIIEWRYLNASQVADRGLCALAKAHREWLLGEKEAWARRLFRFLAFVNQSDWRARIIVNLIDVMRDDEAVDRLIQRSAADFDRRNSILTRKARPIVPDSDLAAIQAVSAMSPRHAGVIDAADNWVVEMLKDAARAPSEHEWQRLLSSMLDGLIGMSFALQWRYNFGRLFGHSGNDEGPDQDI